MEESQIKMEARVMNGNGVHGTIIQILPHKFLVEFDQNINGHAGNESKNIKRIKELDRNCWWFSKRSLYLLEFIEQPNDYKVELI